MCHAQLLSEALRQARKKHRCIVCERDIEPGEQYHSWSMVDELDGFISGKAHLRCSALCDVIEFSDDGCMVVAPHEVVLEEAKRIGVGKLRAMITEAAAKLRSRLAKR